MNYVFNPTSKSFSAVPKDNPKDRINLEIGDSKQTVFIPQVKLMRWDNEVNFSVRPTDYTGGTFLYNPTEQKITWNRSDKQVIFYEIPISEEHPEGGYEMEVVLKSKPASNVLTFMIETKGLDFFYQPALTQEEIDQGASRPENIIGSYAVYHKTKGGMNLADGMDYKVGKAFHIYRPKIIDALGKSVWGELNIDTVLGIQTITIPQDFLDTATYPIRHASGETFGYGTSGTTGSFTCEGTLVGSVFAGGAGTGTKMTASLVEGGTDNAHTAKAGIYIHSDLSYFGTTDERNSFLYTGGKAWYDFTFSVQPTFTAVDYILTVWAGGGLQALYIYYDAGDANQGHYDVAIYGTYPNPLVPTHNNNKYSIYATYTPSGGTVVKDIIGQGIIPFLR